MIIPKKLKKGDTIAIIAPSSGISSFFPNRIKHAKKIFESLGFKVKIFPTCSKFHEGSAGKINERLKDIHDAFSKNDIKAIICAIGGISSNELINKIDYNIIKKNPKIFCGYSDISILHYAIQKKTNLITFYGPAALTQFAEFPSPFNYTIDYFLKVLTQTKPVGSIIPSKSWTDQVVPWDKEKIKRRNLIKNSGYEWLKNGTATGKLIGGCIYSINQLFETKFNLNYTDKIIFLENSEGQDMTKGDPIEILKSQLQDLKNRKIFDNSKGLIIGKLYGYSIDEKNEIKKYIKNLLVKFNFPILYGVNVGHTDPIITIPLGRNVTLNSKKNIFSIDQAGVQ